jgi:hypothetical protein
VKRLLVASLCVYAPHLVEEHLTRIDDEPWMARALGVFAGASPEHAAYVVFQVMLVVALAMTVAWSLGGRARRAVMFALGVALLAEAHHLVRFLASLRYNSGLLTALPMPLVGAAILSSLSSSITVRRIRFRGPSKEPRSCSTTSSSRWGSDESSSA